MIHIFCKNSLASYFEQSIEQLYLHVKRARASICRKTCILKFRKKIELSDGFCVQLGARIQKLSP